MNVFHPKLKPAYSEGLLTVILGYYSLEQEWKIEKNKAGKEGKPWFIIRQLTQWIQVPGSFWAPMEEPWRTYLRITNLSVRREGIYAAASAPHWSRFPHGMLTLWDFRSHAYVRKDEALCLCPKDATTEREKNSRKLKRGAFRLYM